MALMTVGSTAYAQFDFGDVIRNEFRQGAQQFQGQIQGQIRDAIQQGIQQGQPFIPGHSGGQHQILPYPPIHQPQPIIHPPIVVQPPVIVHPPGVVQPCPEDSCPTPVPHPGGPGVIITPHPTPVITPAPPTGQPTQPPTQPAPEPAPLPIVQSGQTVSIDGSGFGEDRGTVFLKIGETILASKVIQWTDTVVDVQLPDLPLVDSVDCLIAVLDAQDSIVEKLDITLAPREEEAVGEELVEDVPAEPLPQVEMGTQLELAGEAMGDQAGKIELKLGELTLQSTVVSWSDTEVTVQLPTMGLTQPVDGLVRIIQADGEVNSEIAVQFTSSDSNASTTQQ